MTDITLNVISKEIRTNITTLEQYVELTIGLPIDQLKYNNIIEVYEKLGRALVDAITSPQHDNMHI